MNKIGTNDPIGDQYLRFALNFRNVNDFNPKSLLQNSLWKFFQIKQ